MRTIQRLARDKGGDYSALLSTFEFGDVAYGLNPRLEAAMKELTALAVATLVKRPNPRQSAYLAHCLSADFFFMQADLVNLVFLHDEDVHRYATDEELDRASHASHPLKDFRDFLAHHARYDVVNTRTNLSLWNQFRRTSKAGLEFQILRRRTIHFIAETVFDSIELVATKSGYQGTCITASELRWLYRHREMPLVRRYVRFWCTTREIPQHEIFEHPGWALYGPKNTYRGDWEKVPRAGT